MRKIIVLQHSYEDHTHEDVKLIGVYSSKNIAQEAINRLIKLPGFKDYPDGFSIDEYEINETNWSEGFGM
ncbi:DUF7336 domain-containing protein [Sessilibacter sp. MAH4]